MSETASHELDERNERNKPDERNERDERNEPDERNERNEFERVEGRNPADYLLRTAQQHHVQISAMADTKANILITVSSIVMTLAIGRSTDPSLRSSLLVLSVFTLISLLLAVLAILPRFHDFQEAPDPLPAGFNLLFFGHFSVLDRDRYRQEMAAVLESDPEIYRALVDDLYAMGTYLNRYKYRYLRYSYLSLLTGFVVVSAVQVVVFFAG